MAACSDELADENGRSIYVANIQKAPMKDDFDKIFKRFGKVIETVHIQPRHKPRFAFVTFSTEESAKKAVKAAKSKKGVYYVGCRLWIAPKEDKRDAKRWTSKKVVEEIVGPALINMLHDDCMLSVFSYLSLKEKMICEQVCIRWQQLVLESFGTVRELNFAKALPGFQLVSGLLFEMQAKILTHTTAGLRSLDLGDVMDLKKIEHLLSLVSTSITHFTFYGTYFENARTIKAVKSAMPNLKALCIDGWGDCSDESLTNLVDAFPNIEELSICNSCLPSYRFPCWANIRKLSIHKCHGYDKRCRIQTMINKVGDSLEELYIGHGIHRKTITLPCPNLKRLTFKAGSGPPDGDLMVDFSNVSLLEELTVISPHVFMEFLCNFSNLAQHCPKLWKLTLYSPHDRCLEWSSHDWDQLTALTNLTYLDVNFYTDDVFYGYRVPLSCGALANLTNLQTLLMPNAIQITREDVVAIISGLPRLKLLNIRGAAIAGEDDEENTEINFIEEMCDECVSDGNRPTLELVIARCSVRTERQSYKYGRFIISNPVTPRNASRRYVSDSSDEEDFRDYDSDDDYLFGFGQAAYPFEFYEYDDFALTDDDDDDGIFYFL